MTTLQKILEELPTNFKEITFELLEELGYKKGSRYIFSETNGDYALVEMLNDDTLKQASFSFLYTKTKKAGVTLPHDFDYYCSVDPEWVRR